MQAQGPQSTPPRRYIAIDGLRFVAAMGVVMHHYSGFAGAPLAEAVMSKNYLFVDFFFAISGFVIFHNYGRRLEGWSAYMDFLRNRLARVYPLHLATFLIFLVLAFTLWRDKADRDFVSATAILPNLLLTHSWGVTQATSFNYPSWSISAEWLAYLSFPLFAWLIRRGGASAALVVAALMVAALEAAQKAGMIEPWTTLTYHYGALRALPTFLFGAVIAHSIDALPLRTIGFAPGMAAFLAAVTAMVARLDDRFIVLLLMAAFVATAIAERNGARGFLTRSAMARLGDLSYAIYMIHPLVAIAFINLFALKIAHLSGNTLVVWCLFCAIVPNLMLGDMIHAWFEKPARDWIRNFRTRALPALISQPYRARATR